MATKDLDFGNVIKQVYDPPTESLKVLATISIGSITVDLDAATDSVRLGDGTVLSTFTTFGPKNALDVNIAGGNLALDISHTDDSIRLGDGTTLFTGSTVGLKTGLDVNLINSSLSVTGSFLTDAELRASPVATTVSGVATEAKQDAQITSLVSIDNKLTSPLVVTATSFPLPAGAAVESKQDAQIAELVDVNANLNTANASLASIDSKLTAPLSVVATGTVNVAEPLQIAGTDNGLSGGTEYGYVYNQKQQVLASHDREEIYTYADFGTKNQRVTRVDYTSNTFPGIIARRDFNYILDSGRYRLVDSVWSIV
jgi:hypothetical protein